MSVSKTPDFPAFSPSLLWSGNNGKATLVLPSFEIVFPVLFLASLSTVVVAPITCSLTICPITCMVYLFDRILRREVYLFDRILRREVYLFDRGKLPRITASCG